MKTIKILIIALILMPVLTIAKTIKIAVIDTGYDPKSNVKLCSDKSIDFTDDNSLVDDMNHGKHVVELLTKNLTDVDHCIIVFKIFSKYNPKNPILLTIEAIKKAIEYKVDYINYSAAGEQYFEPEYQIIKQAAKRKIKIFVAAGNKSMNLDISCNSYPICYKLNNIYGVGNMDFTSNFGTIVKFIEDGKIGINLNGTSFSCPIALAKYIKANLRSPQSNMESAVSEALIKHYGMDTMIENWKNLYISKDVQVYIGWTVQVTKIIIDRQIVFKITFK